MIGDWHSQCIAVEVEANLGRVHLYLQPSPECGTRHDETSRRIEIGIKSASASASAGYRPEGKLGSVEKTGKERETG